jgi:VWFA-related protein
VLLFAGAMAQAREDGDGPRESGMAERTRSGLAQIDVTITGEPDAIASLAPDDFRLYLNHNRVDDLIVDSLCSVPDATSEPSVPRTAPTYLFYFDQNHLTMSGRQNAADLTISVIRELIRDGSRAAIVSAGRRFETVTDFTDDIDALSAGINHLRNDMDYFDPYASLEAGRLEDTRRSLSTSAGCAQAKLYQIEELWRAERALRLFAITLNRFTNVAPPKIVLFFADTLRLNAGEHYYEAAGGRCPQAGKGILDAQGAFNRVIEEAAAARVRVYAVQAEGLVATSVLDVRSAMDIRVRDAQAGLKAIALENGGDAFLNGAPARVVAARIREDLGCMYLLSFDPEPFAKDLPLPVKVKVKHPGVEVHARGQMVLQSDSHRRTSRLLAAFASPNTVRSELQLETAVIPLGFDQGQYKALVQVIARAPHPLKGREWDLGASLVSAGLVRADASGHLTVADSGLDAVFEAEMRFRPGPFEIIAVGHETQSDSIGATSVTGTWPEFDRSIVLSDFAVVQSREAAFVRDEETRQRGSVAATDSEVRAEAATAFTGLVCLGRGKNRTVHVARKVVGKYSAEFPELDFGFAEERCSLIQDIVQGSTLLPGRYTYEVSVGNGGPKMTVPFDVVSSREIAAPPSLVRPP